MTLLASRKPLQALDRGASPEICSCASSSRRLRRCLIQPVLAEPHLCIEADGFGFRMPLGAGAVVRRHLGQSLRCWSFVESVEAVCLPRWRHCSADTSLLQERLSFGR